MADEENTTGMTDEEVAALDQEIADGGLGEKEEVEPKEAEVAEEKTDDDKGDEAKPAETEETGEEKAGEEELQAENSNTESKKDFDVEYKADVPDGLDEKLSEIPDKIDALEAQLDDGDIDLDDYKKQMRELYDEREELKSAKTKADLFSDINQQKAEQQWSWEQESFLTQEGSEIYQNAPMYAALSSMVDTVINEEGAANMSGPEILAESDRRVKEMIGMSSAEKAVVEEPKEEKKVFDIKQKPAIPKTLGNVPASQTNENGGEFAALEAMDSDSRTNAMSKMSESQLNRYLAEG